MDNANITDTVAIFLPSFGGGGAERVAVTLANALAERRHRVHLLAGISDGPNRAAVSAAVSVTSFGRQHVRSCIMPLAHWLRSYRPAVLLSFMKHANMAAAVASLLSRSSHRLVLSDRTSPSVSLASERWLARLLISAGIWSMYRRADAIVAVSKSSARDLCTTYGLDESLVKVIYNPVDVGDVQQQASEATEERWWPMAGKRVILSVGRLTRAKDHITLLDAFARIRGKTNTTLVIIGEGELRPPIEEHIRALGIQKDVILPGFVPKPVSMMARANCFVLSSQWEGFPNVLLEAAAVGTPIVATDCPGGSREILGGIEGAELVPVGDAETMSKAIERALCATRPVTALMRRAEEFSVAKAVFAYEEALGLYR